MTKEEIGGWRSLRLPPFFLKGGTRGDGEDLVRRRQDEVLEGKKLRVLCTTREDGWGEGMSLGDWSRGPEGEG